MSQCMGWQSNQINQWYTTSHTIYQIWSKNKYQTQILFKFDYKKNSPYNAHFWKTLNIVAISKASSVTVLLSELEIFLLKK